MKDQHCEGLVVQMAETQECSSPGESRAGGPVLQLTVMFSALLNMWCALIDVFLQLFTVFFFFSQLHRSDEITTVNRGVVGPKLNHLPCTQVWPWTMPYGTKCRLGFGEEAAKIMSEAWTDNKVLYTDANITGSGGFLFHYDQEFKVKAIDWDLMSEIKCFVSL